MRLRYETGVATFVQFIVGTLLSFVGGGISIVGDCHGASTGDCVSNALVSLVLIIITAVILGALLLLGYAAQERRSSRLAIVLIGAEAFAALIYLFDAKQSPDFTGHITNLISFLIAAWIILIALRLVRARGGRIVRRQTTHHPDVS